MRAEPCHDRRGQIGELAVGCIDAAADAELRAHAAGCEGCRLEIEALEPVGRLLGRADPQRIATPAVPAPQGLDTRLAARLEGERRSRRLRLRVGMAAGLAALAAAAGGGVLLTESDPPDPAPERLVFDTGDPAIGLAATLTPRPWGTEIAVAVRGIEEGTRCRVWLIGPDGTREGAGSFVYRYGRGSDEATLTSAAPSATAQSIEIKAAGRTFAAPLG